MSLRDQLQKFGRNVVQENLPEEPEQEQETRAEAPPRPLSPLGQTNSAIVKALNLEGLGAEAAKQAYKVTDFLSGNLDQSLAEREVGPNEQFQQDFLYMGDTEFVLKYGPEAAERRIFQKGLPGGDAVGNALAQQNFTGTPRDFLDNIAGFGAAVPETLASAASIPLGLVEEAAKHSSNPNYRLDKVGGDERLSNRLVGLGQGAGEFIRKAQSESRGRQLDLKEILQAPRYQDTADRFAELEDTPYNAGRRFAADFGADVDSWIDNPAATQEVVAQALGSMGPSLYVTSKVASTTKKALLKMGVKEPTADLVQSLAVAGTIGSLEGRGAYSDAYDQVMAMSQGQLSETSEDYQELRSQGMSHEDARREVAEQSGIKAQYITTIWASAAGYTVAGFEGSPLKKLGSQKIRNVLSNTAGQTIEEGFQNALSTYASNEGIREFADPSKDVLEGVGKAGAEGVLGGFGATLGISGPQAAPDVIGKTFNLGAKGTALGTKTAFNYVKNTPKRLQAIRDKASQAATGKTVAELKEAKQAAIHEATEMVVEVGNQLEGVQNSLDLLKKAEANPELFSEKDRAFYQGAQKAIDEAQYDFGDTSSEAFLEGLPEKYHEGVKGETSRLGAIYNVINKIRKNTVDSVNDPQLAEWYLNKIDELDKLYERMIGSGNEQSRDIAEAIEPIVTEENGPTAFGEALEQIGEQEQAAGRLVPVKSAIEYIRNPVGINPARISEEAVAPVTPEESAEWGDAKTTRVEATRAAGRVVKAIESPEHARYNERGINVGNRSAINRQNTTDEVRKELLFTRKNASWGDIPSFNDLLSNLLKGGIKNAVEGSTVVVGNDGIEVDAQDSLAHLRNLIQHTRNKFEAGQRSYDKYDFNQKNQDTSEPYDTLDKKSPKDFVPASNWKKTKKKGNRDVLVKPQPGDIYVNPKAKNSLDVWKAIAEEHNVGVRAHNALLEQFPETYQGEKLAEIPVPTVAPIIGHAQTPQNETQSQEQNPEAPTPPDAQGITEQEDQPVPAQPAVAPSPPDSRGFNTVDFSKIFKGGNSTTLAEALDYLTEETNLSSEEISILSIINASNFGNTNSDIIVRRATPAEITQYPGKTGWWNEKTGEIVLIANHRHKLLHEMIHAVTLENLRKHLLNVLTKQSFGDELSKVEQSVLGLYDGAMIFMATDPKGNQQMLKVQRIMQKILQPNVPATQQLENTILAISEYMAYGLTEKSIADSLKDIKYENPDLASRIFNMIKEFLLGLFGENVRNPEAKNAWTKLFLDTQTLTRDTISTRLNPQNTGIVDEQSGTEEEVSPAPQVAESQGETNTEESTPQPPTEDTLKQLKDLPDVDPQVLIDAEQQGVDTDSAEFQTWLKEKYPNHWENINSKPFVLAVRAEEYANAQKAAANERAQSGTAEEINNAFNEASIWRARAKGQDRIAKELSKTPKTEPLVEPQKPVTLEDAAAAASESTAPAVVDNPDSRVRTQKKISRRDLKDNPDTVYLFGDNDVRKGKGGQAASMRGEPNAYGIRTKKVPSNQAHAFYRDDTFEENKAKIDEDFTQPRKGPRGETLPSLVDHVRGGGEVIIPEDGLGTGRAQLAHTAPKTAEYLNKMIDRLIQIGTEEAVEVNEVALPADLEQQAADDAALEEQLGGLSDLGSTTETQTEPVTDPVEEVDAILDETVEEEQSDPEGLPEETKTEEAINAIADTLRNLLVPDSAPANDTPSSPSTTTSTPETTTADAVETTAVEPVVSGTEVEPITGAEVYLAPVQESPVTKPRAEPTPAPEPGRPIGAGLVGDIDGKSYAEAFFAFNPVLQTNDSLKDLILRNAENLDYELPASFEAAIEVLHKEALTAMGETNVRMDAAIRQKNYSDRDAEGNPIEDAPRVSLLDLLQKHLRGETKYDPTQEQEGKSLVFLNQESVLEGKPKYDAHVIYLATMAMLDYAVNDFDHGGVYKAADVLQRLGIKSSAASPTVEMYRVANFGLPASELKSQLIRHVKDFWGGSFNNEITDSRVQASIEALVDELLDTFTGFGLAPKGQDLDAIPKENYWFQMQVAHIRESETGDLEGFHDGRGGNFTGTPDRTYMGVRTGKRGPDMEGMKTVLRDTLTRKDAELHTYRIGEPFSEAETAKHTKKDWTLKLLDMVKNAIRRQQAVPYYVSEEFLKLYNKFGRETLANLLGRKLVGEDDFINYTHAEARKGKNRSVEANIDRAMEMVEEVIKYAQKNGIENIHEVPIYYRYEISANSRYFMQGPNPQLNKFLRQMISATRQTVELTPENKNLLWAAVAQSLGVKIENFPIEKVAEMGKALITEGGEFFEAAEAMRSGELGDAAEAKLAAAFAEKGLEEDAFSLKGIWEGVRLLEAEASGAKELDTDMYMELDGKTHGPLAAAIQMFTGQYTPTILQTWRRGGYFLGQPGFDYAKWRSQDESNTDLYEGTAGFMNKYMLDWKKLLESGAVWSNKKYAQWFKTLYFGDKNHKNSKYHKGAFDHLTELIQEFGHLEIRKNPDGGVSYVIKRKGTKDAITQNVYGAQLNSISAGLANDLQKMIYEEITEAIQNKDTKRLVKLAQHYERLMEIGTKFNKKTGQYTAFEPKPGTKDFIKKSGITQIMQDKSLPIDERLKKLQSYSFNQQQFQRLRDHIKVMYMPHFEKALYDLIDPSIKENNETLMNIGKLQSAVYRETVLRAVEERRKELIAAGKLLRGQEIPRADYMKILEDHKKYSPLVTTAVSHEGRDSQIAQYNISGTAQESSTDVKLRREQQIKDGLPVEEPFRARSRTFNGRQTGSKRLGFKDPGVAILPNNVISNSDVLLQTLAWNDPEYPIFSTAVHDGNQFNVNDLHTAAYVMNKAVGTAWTTNTLKPILKSVTETLGQENLPEDLRIVLEPGTAPVPAVKYLQGYARRLDAMVRYRDARIQAESEVARAIDGMPGVQSPYTVEGAYTGLDDRSLANILEKRTKKLYEESTPKREKQSSELPATGDDMDLTPAVYVGNEIDRVINDLSEALTDPEDRNLLKELLQSPAYKQLRADNLTLNVTHTSPEQEGDYGSYSGDTNELRISSQPKGKATTLLHELVHSATVHQLHDHYRRWLVHNEDLKGPAKSLDNMLKELLSLPAEGMSQRVEEVLTILDIQQRSGRTNYSAVAELITYGLTDPEFKTFLKEHSPKQGFFRRLINSVLGLLGIKSSPRVTSYFDKLQDVTFEIMQVAPSSTQMVEGFKFNSVIPGNANEAAQERERKSDLMNQVNEQISFFLNERARGDNAQQTRARAAKHRAEFEEAKVKADDAYNRISAAGFSIDGAQDNLLFRMLHSIVNVESKLDKIGFIEMQRLFEGINEKLTLEHFLNALGVDANTASEQQKIDAENMLKTVAGVPFYNEDGTIEYRPAKNANQTTDQLATFIALAQTSPEFREVLQNLEYSDLGLDFQVGTDTFDNIVGSTAQRLMNRLNRRIINVKGNEDLQAGQAMDVLTELLLHYNVEAATELENRASSFFNRVNTGVKETLDSIGDSTAASLRRSATDASSELSELMQRNTAKLADMLNEDRATRRLDQITSMLNDPRVPEAVRALFAELRGIYKDVAHLLQLVKKAKDDSARTRQLYVENVPKIIKDTFSEAFQKQSAKKKKRAYKVLHNGLGMTDAAVVLDQLGEGTLYNSFGNTEASQLTRESLIKDIHTKISDAMKPLGLSDALHKKVLAAYIAKAEQYANYMMTYETGNNLLTMSKSIMHLLQEDGGLLTESEHSQLQRAIENTKNDRGEYGQRLNNIARAIDLLGSMEAINRLDPQIHQEMRELISNERETINDIVKMMRNNRDNEENKQDDMGLAHFNGFKGHFPSNTRAKYSVIIAADSEQDRLAKRGYTKMRAYKGPETELMSNMGNHSYYFSAHNRLATYNQGIIQTVQDTYFGIDPLTGMEEGFRTSGEMITGKDIDLLSRRIKNNPKQSATDGLIPRFSSNGSLIGYQRALAPDMIAKLQMTEDIAESLGKWAGRIHEEKMAWGINMDALDAMNEQWVKDRDRGRGDEYVAFGRERKADGTWGLTEELEKDPIWREAYFLIPKEARDYAHEQFKGPIMIRRDLINNTVGFRSASIGDIYTGKTRLGPKTVDAMQTFFRHIPGLGDNAFKHLTDLEDIIQQAVSEVKHIIVVKSGVVMAWNTASNFVQLTMREVPATFITKNVRSKVSEIEDYRRSEELRQKLVVDQLAAHSKSEQERIQARIESIDSKNRRLSIWPLLEAHQFTTISDGLTDVDKANMDGKIMDWVEAKAVELPGPFATVARYGLVSKDTALYRGLAKSVQYSDFIAKAILFDFLTTERGMSVEDAMLEVDQEFINYDLNDSRLRTGLEGVGLTWFMNFKLRSLKVALSLLKNNPATVLMSMMGANILGVDTGTVVTDNVAGAAGKGTLDNAFGWGMAEAGIRLHPVAGQILN